LETLGQRFPGASRVLTPDPQIPSLMPWQSATATPSQQESMQHMLWNTVPKIYTKKSRYIDYTRAKQ